MDIKSDMLTESKSLRETVIDRVDVLDKVKKISMMPDDLNASVEMVADYYEVPLKTIQATIVKNKDELLSDGMKVIRGHELTLLKQVSSIPKNAPSFTMIPRRAILRIGMLLQDSEVAKAVRSYLLDKEVTKSAAIPDVKGLSPLLQTLIHIETRQNNIESRQDALENNQKLIAETILTHDKNWRKSINSMVNAAVYRLNTTHADLRNKSYAMLDERAHCNIKTRLKRWHDRLEALGHSKSKIEEVTRMDVIENDAKLKEIYTAIIKELHIGSLKLITN